MRKYICIVLTVLLLISCIFTATPTVGATDRETSSRAIAIVFDNSGSMYENGEQAWCRATYAMEVFASMLNKGDTLYIYPMHPITVGSSEYTMEKPFQITDAGKASVIRDIHTKEALGTPIESVDCAVEGLKKVTADKKYMIVLTDGDSFYENDIEMSASETKTQLDKRFAEHANKNMTIMYLGIGSNVVMPDTKQSEFFSKKQAANSEDTLSALTYMCNQIFGRDTLPKNHISGKEIDIDITMKKVIVFVQGENVSNVKLTGKTGTIGKESGSASTKYGTKGCGNYESVPDKSLQGMMVTYEDCSAGTYTLDYTGNATSIEIYYEPDADLDFVFTDAAGKSVDYKALYEGDYKVSFGIKDAKTGKLISSDLLGNPHYEGGYVINGKETPIVYDGHSGEVPVSLKMNDSFGATLTVTYLSGYTITKDSTDFGWPKDGIKVAARPAGDLRIEISGGSETYSLMNLTEGEPFTVQVYYKDSLLTGAELEKVEFKWDEALSNANIVAQFAEDHYNFKLDYKNPEAPSETPCGECTVPFEAVYSEKGSSPAKTDGAITYEIEEDAVDFKMDTTVTQDYIVISELKNSEAIKVQLTVNGNKLTAEEFASTQLSVNSGGIEYEITPIESESAYSVKLLPTKGLSEGDYNIVITANYVDGIGRTTQAEDTIVMTLSNIPLWVKWLAGLIILGVLIALILLILHIKVFPGKAHVNKRDCSMIFDDEDDSRSTTFFCKINKKQMQVNSKYAGTKFGLNMDVDPGQESYLMKPQVKRSVDVKSATVRKFGTATIQEASINNVKYVLNEESGKLERTPPNVKPITLKHGSTIKYSGTVMNAGGQKPFSVTQKLNFKKK